MPSQVGLEPTIFGSGNRRLVHLATGTCTVHRAGTKKKYMHASRDKKENATTWDRTKDLSVNSRPLCQRSSGGNEMNPEGFEPPTFGSGIRRAAVAPWVRGADDLARALDCYTQSPRNKKLLATTWDRTKDLSVNSRPLCQRSSGGDVPRPGIEPGSGG